MTDTRSVLTDTAISVSESYLNKEAVLPTTDYDLIPDWFPVLATATTYAGAAYFYPAFDIPLLGTHEGDSMTYFTL